MSRKKNGRPPCDYRNIPLLPVDYAPPGAAGVEAMFERCVDILMVGCLQQVVNDADRELYFFYDESAAAPLVILSHDAEQLFERRVSRRDWLAAGFLINELRKPVGDKIVTISCDALPGGVMAYDISSKGVIGHGEGHDILLQLTLARTLETGAGLVLRQFLPATYQAKDRRGRPLTVPYKRLYFLSVNSLEVNCFDLHQADLVHRHNPENGELRDKEAGVFYGQLAISYPPELPPVDPDFVSLQEHSLGEESFEVGRLITGTNSKKGLSRYLYKKYSAGCQQLESVGGEMLLANSGEYPRLLGLMTSQGLHELPIPARALELADRLDKQLAEIAPTGRIELCAAGGLTQLFDKAMARTGYPQLRRAWLAAAFMLESSLFVSIPAGGPHLVGNHPGFRAAMYYLSLCGIELAGLDDMLAFCRDAGRDGRLTQLSGAAPGAEIADDGRNPWQQEG